MGGSTPNGKSFEIPKRLIVEAWEKVRANGGASGVDTVTVTDFGSELRNNLYKLWNRMSAGSYLPAPVRAVEIPKDHGAGVRTLGVPVVADRVAQTAVARLLEEKLEPIFHPDSYGYRPGRSAHDALAQTRRRCWKQNWVLDLDIQAFFDSVPHDLLLKAVAHHTDERWVLLYIGRWLTAPMQMPDGTLLTREKGTPQGSPMTPPTHWATSVLRCRWSIAGWNGRGVFPSGDDMSSSMLVTCLGVARLGVPEPVATSSLSGSMRPLTSWMRVWGRRRRFGCSRTGMAVRRVRRTVMCSGPASPATSTCRPRRWCSRSSCRGRWSAGSVLMRSPLGAPCRGWWPRRWRSSWRGRIESVRDDDRAGDRDRVRLRSPACRGTVGGLPHPCPRTTVPHGPSRSGSELCR